MAPRTVVGSGSVIGHRFAGLRSPASDSAPAENVEGHANHRSCSTPPRLVPGPPRHAARAHASTPSSRQASGGRRPTPEGRTPHVGLPPTWTSRAGRVPVARNHVDESIHRESTRHVHLAPCAAFVHPHDSSPCSASPGSGGRPRPRSRGAPRRPAGTAAGSPRGLGWSSTGGAPAASSS
jgi:hypothetical protein